MLLAFGLGVSGFVCLITLTTFTVEEGRPGGTDRRVYGSTGVATLGWVVTLGLGVVVFGCTYVLFNGFETIGFID